MGLLRNVVFCHPDPERSEGEGSIHRRDSSSFGLRRCPEQREGMTGNCVFRNSPQYEQKKRYPIIVTALKNIINLLRL